MINEQIIDLPDLITLETVAKQLSQQIPTGSWVFLQGDLGAGKTTFAKAFIKHKGCNERVTSPTYALMQDYQTDHGVVIHCDLYRLGDPEELYEIGLLDMAEEKHAITLVEWASKGRGVLPKPDFTLAFVITDFTNEQRQLTITEHHNEKR